MKQLFKRMYFRLLKYLNVTDTYFGFKIEVAIKKLIVDVKYCINLCSIALNLCISAFYIEIRIQYLHCNCVCMCVCVHTYLLSSGMGLMLLWR